MKLVSLKEVSWCCLLVIKWNFHINIIFPHILETRNLLSRRRNEPAPRCPHLHSQNQPVNWAPTYSGAGSLLPHQDRWNLCLALPQMTLTFISCTSSYLPSRQGAVIFVLRQTETEINQDRDLVDALKHYNSIILLFKGQPSFPLPFSFINTSNCVFFSKFFFSCRPFFLFLLNFFYDIASVLCFDFWQPSMLELPWPAMEPTPLHWKVRS